MSRICFSRLDGTCDAAVSIPHPLKHHGHGGNSRYVNARLDDFKSERMDTNSEPGRFLIEKSPTNRPGAIPSAMRQINSRQGPAPVSDRIHDDQAEEE